MVAWNAKFKKTETMPIIAYNLTVVGLEVFLANSVNAILFEYLEKAYKSLIMITIHH